MKTPGMAFTPAVRPTSRSDRRGRFTVARANTLARLAESPGSPIPQDDLDSITKYGYRDAIKAAKDLKGKNPNNAHSRLVITKFLFNDDNRNGDGELGETLEKAYYYAGVFVDNCLDRRYIFGTHITQAAADINISSHGYDTDDDCDYDRRDLPSCKLNFGSDSDEDAVDASGNEAGDNPQRVHEQQQRDGLNIQSVNTSSSKKGKLATLLNIGFASLGFLVESAPLKLLYFGTGFVTGANVITAAANKRPIQNPVSTLVHTLVGLTVTRAAEFFCDSLLEQGSEDSSQEGLMKSCNYQLLALGIATLSVGYSVYKNFIEPTQQETTALRHFAKNK
ncbi:hypothetical protein DID80_00100 [Candidatus Marinamargulisbacteria bacterium SCGC AAA071-K20]|nr:hypothetical protein DID80_00100 [Candidatus Marinamargulisbacteria bacterium SCGC AAA071-K20]